MSSSLIQFEVVSSKVSYNLFILIYFIVTIGQILLAFDQFIVVI